MDRWRLVVRVKSEAKIQGFDQDWQQMTFKHFSTKLRQGRQRCENCKNSHFCSLKAINSSKTKIQIFTQNVFFVYLKATFMQIFKWFGQETKKTWGFEGHFFLNPCQNPVFLPVFYLNFCSNGQPTNQMSIKSEPRRVRGQMSTFWNQER